MLANADLVNFTEKIQHAVRHLVRAHAQHRKVRYDLLILLDMRLKANKGARSLGSKLLVRELTR
jgi:hypothetical protein